MTAADGALVIVEGTCGAGKTTLVRSAPALLPDRDVRLLLQRDTYKPIAPLEDAGTLDDASHRSILAGVVQRIRDERVAGRWIVVDTLHATQFVRTNTLTLASFREIDRALAGALLVIIRVGERAIRERAIVGRRGTGFEAYARKFGASEDERTRYFMTEQERLLAVVRSHSCLPHVVLDGELSTDVLQAHLRDAMHAHASA